MNLRLLSKQVLNNFTVRHFVLARSLAFIFFAMGFSPLMVFAENRCSIVKILSGKQLSGHKFSQQGVGWVYSWTRPSLKAEKDSGLNIVVPAHVVFEADKVFAECKGEMAEVFLKGFSATYDLAVLGFIKPEVERRNFVSLFKINNDNSKDLKLVELDKNIFANQHLMNLSAAHFKGSKLIFTTLGIENNDFKKEFNIQFPQYRKSILNYAGAIRPGMSGSPLFHGANTFPIGMNLKTKINDHVSLVLPTEEILPLLPELEKGKDPWKKEHPLYDIGFYHQLDPANKVLQRFRQLVVRDSQGTVIERYSEQCNFGSMVETTNWAQVDQAAVLKDLGVQKKLNQYGEKFDWGDYFQNKSNSNPAKINKNWGDLKSDKIKNQSSGGSWGDSGGGLNGVSTDNTLYTEDYNNTSDKNYDNSADWVLKKIMFSGNSQYFLSKEVCRKEGLITETFPKISPNKVLLASKLQLKDGPLITVKMDDLESLLLVFKGEQKLNGAGSFGESASTNRIYKSDERASLKLICNKDLLGSNLKVYGNKIDASESETLLPSRPWTDFDVKRMFAEKVSSHMLLVREKKYLSKMEENEVVYMECDSDGESIDIVAENHDWSYRFKIEDGKLSGRFSISYIDRTYDIEGEKEGDGHLWKYIAEDPSVGYKIEVVLNPMNDPLVSIRFIEIPKKEKLKYSFSFNNAVPSLEFMESLWYVRD